MHALLVSENLCVHQRREKIQGRSCCYQPQSRPLAPGGKQQLVEKLVSTGERIVNPTNPGAPSDLTIVVEAITSIV